MKRLVVCLALAAWGLPPAVWAETVYVTGELTTPLRADVTPGAPTLATLSTGAALDVVERSGGFVRVRDHNGVEGWVDAGALVSQPPAALQLKTVQAALGRARARLADLTTQLNKAQATPDANKLKTDLARARAQLGSTQAELKKKGEELAAAVADRDAAVKEAATLRQATARQAASPAAPAASPTARPPVAAGGFSLAWLAIAFAMLLVGFVGGIVWVKQSIRRRMGGLYLRI